MSKAAGKYKGRKPTAQLKGFEIRQMYRSGIGASEIARKLDIGRASVYRVLSSGPAAEGLPKATE